MAKPPCLFLPSLLSADLMNLGYEATQLINAGADLLHVDVMDNHYVPNLTFGPLLCKSLHDYAPSTLIDVHLMVTPVDELIKRFAEAGASRITIHPESTLHLDRSLALIRELNCQAGLALNPSTSPDILRYCVHKLDFVLIMMVNPGFAGQTLISEILDKISLVHQDYPNLPICVDGGVSLQNISKLTLLGATQFITGSSLFNGQPYTKTLQEMRNAYAKA